MAAEITSYKCTACTGPLHFNEQIGKLKCDFCGATYEVAEMEAAYGERETAAAHAHEHAQQQGTSDWNFTINANGWSNEEAAQLRAYSCTSCGAEIVCDLNTAATACPYCDNPVIVPGQFHGMLRPDFVIPFRLDKQAAINALSAYYKGKKFLPKLFSANNHIEEIKGIYVPFWLYDAKSFANITFKATLSHVHRQGDQEITTTDHYRVFRQGNISFSQIPVDGSTQMPDAHMDAIEPFDYGELKPFSTAYLPGFLADKYDVDAEAGAARANERVTNSTITAFRNTVMGYQTVIVESSNINLEAGDVKYALFPVWLLATKWKDENFLFAMNGQTGKLIGDLPVDMGKFWAWFFGISLPIAVLLAFILFGLGG